MQVYQNFKKCKNERFNENLIKCKIDSKHNKCKYELID